jgi:rhomboid protease GluP
MKINEAILAGQYWRLFTPALLHGSIFHIGFNMYALIVIGVELEKRFGSLRFTLLYLSGAFAGNVVSFLMSPNPSLGASTAIFGLLGAELIFFYRNQKIFGPHSKRALQNVITIAAVNFLIGLSPGIDNWGHLGGFLGGVIFTWFSGPILGFAGTYPLITVLDQREKIQYALGAAIVFLFFSVFVYIRVA